MNLKIFVALQLLQTFSHFANSAILPSQHLTSRDQVRESQQEFDETTARFKQESLCRHYLDSTDKKKVELNTCVQKCGDLVGKSFENEDSNSLRCTSESDNVPEIADPDGDRYTLGKCICEVPMVNQVVDETSLSLPVVADIGCPIIYRAFDAILDVGAAAIPGVEAPMDVGMNASIQAAKTISDSGKEADSFLNWFDQPCDAGNYTDVVSKIFNPLCDVPDPAIANIDSKVPQKKDKRSPKGKGGSGGSKGSSGGSKPPDNPPPKKEEQKPAQPPKKNDPPSASAKKPDVTAAKPDKKPTKATKPVTSSKSKVQPTSSSQKKSNKVTPSSLAVTKSSRGQSQSSKPTVLPSSIQSSESEELSIVETSEPQDIAPATSSAGEPDTVAVVATDEVEDSVFATPSASVPESVEAVATSELLDVSPSASITDSASLSTEQPFDTDAQPLQSIEDEPTATSLGTVEDESAATSSPTIGDEFIATPSGTLNDGSSALDQALAVTDEPQQTMGDEATAVDPALVVETSDVSAAIATPSLPTETNEESSLEPDELALPTTLKTSTIAQPTASEPPEATSECPAESTDVAEAEDGTIVIKQRNVNELTMRQTPKFGGTFIGFVEVKGDCANLRQYAIAGYNQIRNSPEINSGAIIVAAMWVRSVGVIVASKPRPVPGSQSTKVSRGNAVAHVLRETSKEKFPEYWKIVKDRDHKDPDKPDKLDLWHAEDAAVLLAGLYWTRDWKSRNPNQSPPNLTGFQGNAQIVTYGKYKATTPLGFVPPCNGNLQPSCTQVLNTLQVLPLPIQSVAPAPYVAPQYPPNYG
ncbi:MAG: hypothetical protein Q9172_006515 [Xanthocarpia lactea]